MRTTKAIKLAVTNREYIRRDLINVFLDEEPGKGTGNDCAQYVYNVEELEDKRIIYLIRPTRNNGFDFTVHVEDTYFGDIRKTTRPRHVDLYNDLVEKLDEDPQQFEKVLELMDKIYECTQVSDEDLRSFKFFSGHSVELILKVVKWLFIEQDITYWNYSGRNKLYSYLKDM